MEAALENSGGRSSKTQVWHVPPGWLDTGEAHGTRVAKRLEEYVAQDWSDAGSAHGTALENAGGARCRGERGCGGSAGRKLMVESAYGTKQMTKEFGQCGGSITGGLSRHRWTKKNTRALVNNTLNNTKTQKIFSRNNKETAGANSTTEQQNNLATSPQKSTA